MSTVTPQRSTVLPPTHSAPSKMVGSNAHSKSSIKTFTNGIQVVGGDGTFGEDLQPYLKQEKVIQSAWDYHIVSVFGSQSTGKSTLLNALFATRFNVMNEEERQQTTKGIWLAKNQRPENSMADNILVMDVEGTDGQERGEDQDFERKSALFALATSEVLLVNMWENQVGLYHGANMGLLKTVFEVNLELFIKGAKTTPRSLLLFVIRDFQGRTPLSNLKKTLINNLNRIWYSISKPEGLENDDIDVYFDFAFAGLPNKYDKPDAFKQEVSRLASRFKVGYKDLKTEGFVDETAQPLLFPDYHRRIPADGFPEYAKSVWDQIQSNKDLDLPTQQELLAQFRCLEISRECLIAFDEIVVPLETDQTNAARDGKPLIINSLGKLLSTSRKNLFQDFETTASRYHTKVYERQKEELETTVDARLKILFDSQLASTHKLGLVAFKDAVTKSVQDSAKSGAQYDFAVIVDTEKKNAITQFTSIAKASAVENTSFSSFDSQLRLFQKDLDSDSAQLRQNEMRLLATRIERWIKAQLDEKVGLEFNKLGSNRPSSDVGSSDFQNSSSTNSSQSLPFEQEHWNRIWSLLISLSTEAQSKFTNRATALSASETESEIGTWRLRRKIWDALKTKLAEELADGNLGGKLRESFEDRFRYDASGVPRVWTANDDIKGAYEKARDAALGLIPLLSVFKLGDGELPPLAKFLGEKPANTSRIDEEDLLPIGGIDDPDKSLLEELTLLADSKRAAAATRFRKGADAIYVETERSLQNPLTQTPIWMWGLMLALGSNEALAVLRSPLLLTLGLLVSAAFVGVWYLNAWGPVLRIAKGAINEGVGVAKDFWEKVLDAQLEARNKHQEKRAHGVAWEARSNATEAVPLETLDKGGKRAVQELETEKSGSQESIWDD